MFKNKSIIFISLFLIALIIAIIAMRNYVFEIAVTSGSSMEPTIFHGDHVLINRLAYRNQEPQKGDIVAIKLGWVMMLKRVFGTPGDIIELKNGILYRNGKSIENKQIAIFSKQKKPSFKPLKVWDKHIFVIGDNIEHSEDSRLFGLITDDNIVGKATLVYFPIGRIRKLK